MLGPFGDYLSIPEVARAACKPERTMRRQLVRLAAKWPGLLTSLEPTGGNVRKYWVDARVLARIERLGEHHEHAGAPAELAGRVDELEQKLLALRTAHLALKRHFTKNKQSGRPTDG